METSEQELYFKDAERILAAGTDFVFQEKTTDASKQDFQLLLGSRFNPADFPTNSGRVFLAGMPQLCTVRAALCAMPESV